MGKYFFYADPAHLQTQQPEQAFGPVAGSDAAHIAGHDMYRLTSLHSVKPGQAAPAIALCDGTICVQEDGAGAYTIILKPNYQPPFDFPYIKYFLYKGIQAASLVNVDSVAFANAGTIPFIQRINDSWEDPVPGTPPTPNPKSNSKQVLGLAYLAGSTFPLNNDPTPRQLFEDGDPIDHLFYFPNPDYQLPTVRAGEAIGLWNNDFGFEIVLERLGYEPQLSLARTPTNYLSVASLPSGSYAHDEATYFQHWHEKEACINYIDPCAFFGSFAEHKVFYQETAPDRRRKCNNAQEIYDQLLSCFYRRNTVYLDVRNDYNQSLNYYKNYGFQYRFVNADGSAIIDTVGDWPIATFVGLAGAGEEKRGFFNTGLMLPVGDGDNNDPTVFLSRAYVRRFRRLKHTERVQQLEQPAGGAYFYNPIQLAFTMVDDGGTSRLSANYHRINLYDRDRSSTSTSTSLLAPPKKHYLDGLFRPLEMVQNLRLREEDLTYTLWHEQLLVDLSAYGGPTYIADVGVAEDVHHVSLFAVPVYFLAGSKNDELPEAFTSFVNTGSNEQRMFLEKLFDPFASKQLTKQELELAGTLDKVETVVVRRNPIYEREPVFQESQAPEDFTVLVWEKSEYAAMLAALQATNAIGGKTTLNTQQVVKETDTEGIDYYRVVLDASYLKNNGTTAERTAIALAKEIIEYAD